MVAGGSRWEGGHGDSRTHKIGGGEEMGVRREEEGRGVGEGGGGEGE